MDASHVKSRVKAAYDEGARSYSKAWRAPWEWLGPERSFVANRVTPGMTMVDVGCGSGRDVAYWSELGLDVLGIDLSTETVSLAQRNYPKLRFSALDLLDLPALNRTFDVVWCSYSLLHIPFAKLKDSLSVLAACTSDNGFIFIAMALADESEERVTTYAGMERQDGTPIEVPIYYWNEGELRSVLSEVLIEEWHRSFVAFDAKRAYSGVLLPRRTNIETRPQ